MILHNKNQRNHKFIIKVILSGFIFSILLINTISAEELNDDCKITITSVVNTNGSGLFQSNNMSIIIADVISEIDHVLFVVPVVTHIYGMNMDDFPGNFSGEHPMGNDFEGEPPDWSNGLPPEAPNNGEFPNRNNVSFLDRNRNQNMVDYIIEGIFLDAFENSGYSIIPDIVSSGRLLEANDTKMVYLGEDAQEYFNITVSDSIEIDNVSFTVIGIFSDDELSKYVFMNMNDAQNLLDLDDSKVNTFYVYVDDEENLETVSSVIEKQYPDLLSRYSGQMGLLDPPFNSPQTNNEGHVTGDNITTPGFELSLCVGVILIGIFYFKRLREGNKS